jgi:hypothetical protein
VPFRPASIKSGGNLPEVHACCPTLPRTGTPDEREPRPTGWGQAGWDQGEPA